MNLFKSKPVTQNLSNGDNLRNFRLLGDEAEILGNRLDHARKMMSTAQSAWAKNYWSQAVERLVFQWRQLPVLHDSESKMSVMPRWTISYEFYERQQEGNLYGVTDRAYDKLFKQNANLDASWHAHREKRLARNQ